jgi:hypothetical protein
MLLAVLGLGCGASDGGESPAECAGSPTCTILAGDCCSDQGFTPTCVDGEWVCDPCMPGNEVEILGCESKQSVFTSECERWFDEVLRDGGSPASCGL